MLLHVAEHRCHGAPKEWRFIDQSFGSLPFKRFAVDSLQATSSVLDLASWSVIQIHTQAKLNVWVSACVCVCVRACVCGNTRRKKQLYPMTKWKQHSPLSLVFIGGPLLLIKLQSLGGASGVLTTPACPSGSYKTPGIRLFNISGGC